MERCALVWLEPMGQGAVSNGLMLHSPQALPSLLPIRSGRLYWGIPERWDRVTRVVIAKVGGADWKAFSQGTSPLEGGEAPRRASDGFQPTIWDLWGGLTAHRGAASWYYLRLIGGLPCSICYTASWSFSG